MLTCSFRTRRRIVSHCSMSVYTPGLRTRARPDRRRRADPMQALPHKPLQGGPHFSAAVHNFTVPVTIDHGPLVEGSLRLRDRDDRSRQRDGVTPVVRPVLPSGCARRPVRTNERHLLRLHGVPAHALTPIPTAVRSPVSCEVYRDKGGRGLEAHARNACRIATGAGPAYDGRPVRRAKGDSDGRSAVRGRLHS